MPLIFDEMLPTSHCNINHHHQRNDLWVTLPDLLNLNPAGYLRSTLSNLDELEKLPRIDKDGFQVCLDVEHFQPKEIAVKTVDNFVVVEAHHEERRYPLGDISRHFIRRFELPEGYKAKDVVSSISSDGILSIKCPKSTPATEGSVRHVQIHHTGPARLNVAHKEEPVQLEAK